MDDPGCDIERLRATYQRLAAVNRWLSGWRAVYRRWLRPRARAGDTLLDMGCGGGDVAARLMAWSAADGIPLRVMAADPDARATAFARERRRLPGLTVRCASASELLEEGLRFDFVISNHVLHHLDEGELAAFLDTSARLARRLAVHNDLRRNDLALLAFAPLRLAFPRSFVVPDGLRSIRRAYLPAELRALAPSGWHQETLAPFRSLLLRVVGEAVAFP